jgi:ATP-dependent Clp protease protease subunit
VINEHIVAADKEEEDDKAKPMGSPVASRLFDSRQIALFGAVDHELALKISAQLLALEAADPEAPITLLMNSPGGSVTDGFAIYDTIRFIAPKVRIVCTGMAASIATVILLAADKEDRLALPNTKLLIHQVYLPGVVRGQASDLEITAKDLLATRDRINELYAKETGQPIDRIKKDTNRDYWMTADEAVEYGLIHRIVATRADLAG